MILVDTSVWIEHFRSRDIKLAALLGTDDVLIHPFVVGELAMGNFKARRSTLASLAELSEVIVVDHDEAMQFIEQNHLFGIGIGLIDAHLLASVRLTQGALLWTHDKRLGSAAAQLGLNF